MRYFRHHRPLRAPCAETELVLFAPLGIAIRQLEAQLESAAVPTAAVCKQRGRFTGRHRRTVVGAGRGRRSGGDGVGGLALLLGALTAEEGQGMVGVFGGDEAREAALGEGVQACRVIVKGIAVECCQLEQTLGLARGVRAGSGQPR
jgi:hypothetical protein